MPLPADTLLDRSRTDWFPDFLSHGQMKPHFQPIVEPPHRRGVRPRGADARQLGAVEVRGELLAAAEAHDALFSFDYRARTAALEVGLPLLPAGEVLFVDLDPRAVLDVEGSLRTTWPVVGRLGADPSRICLELVRPERCADRDVLCELVNAHRKRGALVALDDVGWRRVAPVPRAAAPRRRQDRQRADAPASSTRPRAAASSPRSWTAPTQQGCKVVAGGRERVDEFQAMAELGVDLGQGFYFGRRQADGDHTRLVHPRAELVQARPQGSRPDPWLRGA